jgi:hypothetical protein
VFGHDGDIYPAISHTVRIDPVTRSAIIILSSGKEGFAWRLGLDWAYWKTGNGDNSVDWASLAQAIVIGAGVIAALVAVWVMRSAHSRRRQIG